MGSNDVWKKPRRAKVKSGCRTCKSRRIKCDEGRPACRRCVSSGRVCDGYGVWGGGGRNYLQSQHAAPNQEDALVPWPPLRIFSTEENRYFEWYRYRTAKKIPGAFSQVFWETFLLQASIGEPTVLHAILTLSSVHMRSASNSAVRCTLKEVPEEQEQFMLRQYVKAIDHLQPHFSSRDKSSIRIALISCIIFICIEYFRGHFKTGQLHLMNGLKILDETYSTAQGWVQPHQLRDPIDEWIIRIFSRLHVQRELFNQTDQQLCKVLWAGANFLERMFCSINDAWQELEQLFSSIFMLAQQAHKFQVSGSTLIDYPLSLSKCQQQIQSDLSQWLDTYSRSQGNLQIEYPWEMARHLLSEYHSMATIMVSTALSNVESSYDSHTPDFLSILNHSIAMDKFSAANKREPTPLKLSRNVMDMSHSIVDIGWIPPLFYTALKCRVRRIRAHAIKLIESASHREGIWDSKIASRVARKVIEIEENCVKGPVIDENYGLDIEPQVEKCDKPIIPEEQRVRRTRVNLKDGLVDGVVLMYRKSLGDWEEVNVNLSND